MANMGTSRVNFFPRTATYNTRRPRWSGTTWGRSGIDRVSEVSGGVSWLISWPRKKLITTLTAEPQFSLAA